MKTKLLILGMVLGLLMACGKDEPTPTPDPVQQQDPEPEPEPVLSSEKQIAGFQFTGIENNGVTVNIPGEIDEEGKTIDIEMPSKTEITALEPVLEIPDKAVYEPTGPQDFSTPINYTVTAEDGTSRTYLVTVEVALSQKEILLIISEANPGNTLDWKETDNLAGWEEVTLDGNGDITRLSMNNKGLTIVPPEIGQLSSLEILNLIFNDLSSLPPEIGQLNSLKELFLNYNDLSSLPPEIGQLSSLEILRVNSNDLSSLPPEIGQLNSLEVLTLSSNNLSSLPTEITRLVNLTRLDLRNNNLSQFNHVPFIPSGGIITTIGCSTETNLAELFLGGNLDLEVLDQCICDLDTSEEGGTVEIDVVPIGVSCVGNVIGGK